MPGRQSSRIKMILWWCLHYYCKMPGVFLVIPFYAHVLPAGKAWMTHLNSIYSLLIPNLYLLMPPYIPHWWSVHQRRTQRCVHGGHDVHEIPWDNQRTSEYIHTEVRKQLRRHINPCLNFLDYPLPLMLLWFSHNMLLDALSMRLDSPLMLA